MTDAHHDAPRHDQGCGGEAEFLGPEQRGDHDVATGLQLSIGLHDDAVAQAVQQQRLLGLGEAELPRSARVLERRQRRRPGASVVATDEHDVGMGLGHAGRHRAHANLRHQLDTDAGVMVGVLQIVD